MRSVLKASKSSLQQIKSTKYNAVDVLSSAVSRTVSLNADASKLRKMAEDTPKPGMVAPGRVFTFQELAAATENFNPDLLVGEGGFGRVYKGRLKKTKQVVAVKQLDRNKDQDNTEFLAEVLALSLIEHPNLVSLIGYCADGRQRILVYDKKPPEEEILVAWAKPLLKDRNKFSLLVDPLLQGEFPVKGLHQALAVVVMCLQDEADTRPLIEDVVTALEYLALTTDEQVACEKNADM
ncbi:hypothetical protein SASPL_153910 [Salvia splendens]|uniref:Protein kinase domain-containing protein n=1 Tax=Salvia splendens TaxID=180675 RepID=A0A8X8VZ74_SALSN|nr:hypothetical protein SASPL_153910 [Salvia splendens]